MTYTLQVKGGQNLGLLDRKSARTTGIVVDTSSSSAIKTT